MRRVFGISRINRPRSQAGGTVVDSAEDAQRGAAILEHVLLIGLLIGTFIGVLTLYTLAIKQVACERIFIESDEFAFTPSNVVGVIWDERPGGPGCYQAHRPTPLF